jgi:predicted SnoaL-like aldol condensation-catalyzing enzyme
MLGCRASGWAERSRMNRKESAVSFLKMAGTGNTGEAYAKFIAPDFIHHNQYFKGDRQSLESAMAEAHLKSPNKLIDVKRVFEDGDFVVTHARVVRGDQKEPDIAVVHIFRFQGDKVVELWDVGQLLIPNSPNENGAF